MVKPNDVGSTGSEINFWEEGIGVVMKLNVQIHVGDCGQKGVVGDACNRGWTCGIGSEEIIWNHGRGD
jgi:hypothetical protein